MPLVASQLRVWGNAQFPSRSLRHLLVSVDGEVQLLLLPSSSPSTLLSKVSVEYQEILVEFPRLLALVLRPALPSMMSTTMWRQRADFQKMEMASIIRRSNSPWASALHMVPKPDSSWRPCGDFHRLNNATVPDKYPVPNIRDFMNNVAGSHMFPPPIL